MSAGDYPVGQYLADGSIAGGFVMLARPVGKRVMDLTFFRGAPSVLGPFSFSDPFGPKDATLSFDRISVFDRLGFGDLAWLRKKTAVDIIWVGALPLSYPFGRTSGPSAARVWTPLFGWEGEILGFNFTGAYGCEVTLKGAMYQLDDYLAKPEFSMRPLPYEWAMARQFVHPDRPHLRLAPLQVAWPGWWTTTYTPPAKGTPQYLIPAAVHRGHKWSGLLTRDTGSWNPVLTSYLTTLLQSMYTKRGRFTLDLQRGRVPVLSHRNFVDHSVAGTAVVDLVSDNVKINELSTDWSQSLDIAFAQGVSLAGVAYSGMQVSSDGARTSYQPLAASRQSWPPASNPWLSEASMPREVLLQMQEGLSEYDAAKVALAHLERFGDPGVTGEIELSGDVKLADGSVLPHYLVRAGMPIRLANLFGQPEGLTCYISDNVVDLSHGINKITFDSKNRDALTVEQVRKRGRDAMAVSRMLIGGQYEPPIPDQLLPWNYATGSGMIPSASFRNSLELFKGIPDSVLFPWTKWTKAHPPKSGRWKHCYIEIPPASSNANKNWSGIPRSDGSRYGIGIRMAEAGSIRLLQFAAYDKDGNVLPVAFHLSLYYMSGVNVHSMPAIPAGESHPPYATGQYYPFVHDSFELYNSDGTEKGIDIPLTVQSAALWKAFGTDHVKAGYFPGDGTGDPTGLLVQENLGSFDTRQYGFFDVHSPKGNLTNKNAGQMYAMVYCDQQADQSVYFLGRMFRSEPGAQGGGQ